MRVFASLVLIPLFASVFAQERSTEGPKTERHDYQSDVARLRKIVIESLYSHRDVWLRELVSNANDAIEKFRVVSLQDGVPVNEPLNITLTLTPATDDKPGRIVISDTGIGMSPEELTKNLGTLAKSGTRDFLAKAEAEKTKGTEADPNLIGQFGLGFYSSFLVASDVYVASVPAPSKENPNPSQHVFASASDASSFDVYPDPRGNTLGRGTEITLVLRDDAKEYLEERKIRDLISKHSAFSTAYPIYLWAKQAEHVPLTPEDEGYVPPKEKKEKTRDESEKAEKSDEEEGVVEDEPEKPEESEGAQDDPQKTKVVTKWVWNHLNNQPPLWMRDPKNVTDEEYNEFYRATFKDSNNPIAWHHFKGDTGTGTSFRAVIFIPPEIPQEFWNNPEPIKDSVRLFVKRVFITNNLGDQALPKWISWLRAIIDAEDLPLNVSRETLQTTKFMAQAKQVLIKRFIQLVTRIAAEDETKYKKMMKAGYGPLLKLGAVEPQYQKKIVPLIKYTTNLREMVTLDEYVEKRKKGQEQIFFLAGAGESPENLAKSIFVEKLTARGYEVLLLADPMDEILFSQLKIWKKFKLQDVAKEGLKFGDEDEDAETEKAEREEQKVRYTPLINYLKGETKDTVIDVVISTRLVTSPCAIVASSMGYSGNMQRLLQAQHHQDGHTAIMQEWAKKQRVLEINPKSPLIEGLLAKVQILDDVEEGEEKDKELEEELKEVVSIMVDGALVRSGFGVSDSNVFFSRVDRVLRRSLGVSESAKADDKVKPAPPTVEPDEKVEKEELPNMDEEENLANYVVSDKAPFDTTKAVDININDHTEGKVGLAADKDNEPVWVDWDKRGAQNLEDLLKHDEL
ncbi:hypothetical protein FRB99_003272 [Tulasnella sp. 403]|nr:hypothetical protein FRB99_003272 [Tulasnella sp. 403]